MDKIIKRGLRQLRTGFKTLENYRKRNLLKIDRSEIRKKVQSLHEFDEFEFEAEEKEEWGVGSKFRMEAFEIDQERKREPSKTFKITDFKSESIIKFICEEVGSDGVCDNIKVYRSSSSDDPEKSTHILFTSPSTPSRRAILQKILTEFKPLFQDRRISVDGAKDKKAEWIVIDLKGVFVHIFDADTRASVDLDGKLEKEMKVEMKKGKEDDDESISILMNSLKNSLPRVIASRPNFIEKYLKSRQ